MKKTKAIMAIFLLSALLLSGYSSTNSSNASIPPASSTPKPDELSLAPSSTSKPIVPFITPEIINIDLPPELKYDAKTTLVPLVDNRGRYRKFIASDDGRYYFHNTETGALLTMPDGVSGYSFYGNCYVIYKDGKASLLSADGQRTTDFIYDEIWGECWYIAEAKGKYIKVGRELDGGHFKYTIVDVTNFKEMFPFEYDSIEMYNRFLYVTKDGVHKLVDYSNNVILDIGEKELYNITGNDLCFIRTGYYFYMDTIYYVDLPEDIFLRLYKNFVLVSLDDFTSGPRYLSVYNSNGEHLHSTKYYNYYFRDNDNIVIKITAYDFSFDVVSNDGLIKQYKSISDFKLEHVHKAFYEDNVLKIVADNFKTIITVDENMTVTKSDYIEETVGQIFSQKGVQYFVDQNGRIVLAINKDETSSTIMQIGELVIVARDNDYTNKNSLDLYDIYNLKGDLLIENAFGIIYQGYVNNYLVVYKSKTVCGILYPDGEYIRISAPQVEKNIIGKSTS